MERNGLESESHPASVRRRTRGWLAVFVVAVIATYHLVLRPLHRTWGATGEEVA
ncbi:hypothetical protein [Halomicrobium urmianum]|uniref:hypothetical protein n=1 Tax=Halomicrobium urmianum TaxID=1586233 RepID=UPI001CD93F9D|nr:hypothetical protein [Halomicrobium urmianum]